MDEDEILGYVTAYLKKKGFKQTEKVFQEEFQQNKTSSSSNSILEPDIANHLHAFSQLENGPARYHNGYSRLRTWTYSSLDLYKHELLRVLYPVFIHCFMDLVAKGHIQEARNFFTTFREDHELMHLRDIQKLEGVLSPTHLKEMEFAHSLRQSKFNIKICEYSYELLLQHLHSTQSTTILGIINEHINFQVTSGQPSLISDDPEAVTLTGSSQEAANQTNQKEIHWGLLEDSLEERLEKPGALLSDSEKGDGEAKEGENDENKKRSIEVGKQGASSKKMKKDRGGTATGKSAKPEVTTVSAAPRVKAELPLPIIPTEVEHSILEDLRNRVQLSSVALPSVSFYTFINTHNGLSCSSISHDGSLVAGGFSDSSLKVWDMAKLGQQPSSSLSQGENDTSQNEQMLGKSGGKRQYTLFQGHSGPVYAASFCPVGDFILSSSADSTIRLWSTKLNANLVCYKGHNYPVWDVQFSPMGHYFASSSHDRTARVWSMDRIQPLRIMAGHLSDVDCVQWHANCNYIATGSSDKTVRLWDVQSGECVRVFVGHRGMILSLSMSPDGRYMASGDEDGTIMMWDLSSGRCVTPLVGHTSCVWSLAFSSEGSILASGSADCTVKLWDVNTSTKVSRTEEKNGNANRLRSLKTLPTKSTPVNTLRFSRRNLLFAAGALAKNA
ncbi:putative transcription factor WD40-like family [Medicago truncatula]|uniref:Transcription initiation factor TFIID subunit 5 n=1 Tax=Medicago truncatula TaxID=3880 RepID=G7J9V2_MEDTR|nr:transcription initiation factor TFIID subunit 5 [Medicago truncatula]AES73552.2 TBP-associated factor 5 [Medicago truncatula]RHN70572.1 putative transcription factor WD40-like family [Medicago truncatula]